MDIVPSIIAASAAVSGDWNDIDFKAAHESALLWSINLAFFLSRVI